MSMFTISLVLLLIKTASGLFGYDCGGTSFNVTTVSLLDVGECHTTDSRPNSTAVYIYTTAARRRLFTDRHHFLQDRNRSTNIPLRNALTYLHGAWRP
ncbi:hypothetical protein P5V15_007125 [Pogonomyrmex californicus]